ncbi:histidine phosphatase family protein [Paenibacillus xerothermodurans]|uniref:Histidine phosphatase family protein n=1 Tax=Paenibacillus xerothermodurans TaxID=1977292 RepID=A0A2W1P2H8_PAEXE|nr:histidine phosphatase family protein [Paenibacillus xerothermodurans]PZE21932.1 histidine phosphatase family protein [Paenibacillus xerothermodurans]
MITLGFIRHGTTEWNLAGRMQGQMDTELAEVGVRQAHELANRLKSESWDGIVSSDLIRARQTAQTISDVTGIPFIGVDARLRERRFGELEGTTLQERVDRWGESWRELDLGMESDADLLKRWVTFIEELEEQHGGKRILLVSHGGYIAPVLEFMIGEPLTSHINNTSLTVMERDITAWRCLLLNCTAHLEQT